MNKMLKTVECVNCGKEVKDKHPKALINGHPVCLACVKLLNEGVEWGAFIDELDRLFNDSDEWEEEDAQDEDRLG